MSIIKFFTPTIRKLGLAVILFCASFVLRIMIFAALIGGVFGYAVFAIIFIANLGFFVGKEVGDFFFLKLDTNYGGPPEGWKESRMVSNYFQIVYIYIVSCVWIYFKDRNKSKNQIKDISSEDPWRRWF